LLVEAKFVAGATLSSETPHYSTNLAPVYIAEQIFFHVLLHGGEGNPFHKIANKWFIDLAAPKIRALLEGSTK
jgi:hypothetical protein